MGFRRLVNWLAVVTLICGSALVGGATVGASAADPCRLIRSAPGTEAWRQEVRQCAYHLLATKYPWTDLGKGKYGNCESKCRDKNPANRVPLQCVTFAQELMSKMKRVARGRNMPPYAGPRYDAIKAEFDNPKTPAKSRAIYEYKNARRDLLPAELPYAVWWTGIADGFGHVAVYIGEGEFLDNALMTGGASTSKTPPKPIRWFIGGQPWPAGVGTEATGYTKFFISR